MQNASLNLVARPEQARALQRLKIWSKLAKGDLHTITKKDVEELFGVLDTEEQGEISRDDLLVLRQIPGLSLTSEDVENLANDADKDNSGKVNQDELFKALTQGELAYNVVLAALGQKKAALKTTECDKEDLIEYLRFEYETKSSLWSLPQTMILFFAFIGSMTGHIGVSTAYSMQNALLGEIEGEGAPYLHKYVHDVPTFWDWMESSFVSGIFKSGSSDLEIWPYPGRIASYNQIVGGVALNRVNSKPGVCLQSDTLKSFYDTRYGGRCHKQEDTTTDSVYIHYHMRSEEILSQIGQLRKSSITNRSWIDQNTTSVTARMLLYNGHLEAFTMTEIIFGFGADGAVKIKFDMETWLSDPYSNILWVIPDVVFSLIVLRMFYSETLELVPAVMNGIDGFQQYMQFWNIIDWFAIIIGIVVITAWGLISSQVSSILQEKISNLNMAELDTAVFTNRTYLTVGQFEMVRPMTLHNQKINELHTAVASVVFLHRWLRTMIFFYNFALMMKFFKAFQANARLNIVIKTMQTSAIDIIHFLIVFILIFFVFSSAAYVFFGNRMKEFSTQEKALMYCWRILMGEFDVEAMEAVNAPVAYLWILVFQFLVLLILLNMLLAIIMDTYAAVNTPDAETIWTQIRQALHTARETRGHLDMWYLICEFEDEDYNAHQDRVTSKSLRTAFESQKMTKHNADYLIRKTAEFVKAKEAKTELRLTDAVRIISQMKTTNLRVQESVEQIHEMMTEDRKAPQQERFDAIMRGEDPDSSNWKGNQSNNRLASTAPSFGANTLKGSPPTNNRPMLGNGTATGGFGGTATNFGNQAQGELALRPSVMNRGPSIHGARPSVMPGMMPGAADHMEIVGHLEQQQMSLEGIRGDQQRTEQLLLQELKDMRGYVEQRDAWMEQRLNGLDRRFEKVERATDRLTASMQGFDFRELMNATDRVAHFLQLKQQGLAGGGSPSPVRTRPRPGEAKSSPESSSGLGVEEVNEENADQATEVSQRASSSAVAGGDSGLGLGARKHLTTQLDRMGEQVTQLVSHAEESADVRKLLWKMDLNLRQTRAAVQKIEEMGLRAPAPSSSPKTPGEGFARRQTGMRASSRTSPLATTMENGSPGNLGRLPAVPDPAAFSSPS